MLDASRVSFKYEADIVKFKGYDIQAYRFGSSDNVSIAFPGFPLSGSFYLWVMSQYDLAKVSIITFDIPGWAGTSDNIFKNSNIEFNIDTLTEIAQEVVKFYKVKKLNIIGFSYGTALALDYCSKHKQEVEKVVIMSPFFLKRFLSLYFLLWLIVKLPDRLLGELFKLFVYYGMLPIYKKYREINVPDHFLNIIKHGMSKIDAKLTGVSLKYIAKVDFEDKLKALKEKKVLIVTNNNEKGIFKKHADFLKKVLPQSKLMHVNGKHEYMYITPSREFVKKIVDFLNS